MRDDDCTVVERRDPRVGTTLGRFRVDFRIAAGGFGAIYYATDTRSRATVALKILHPKLARDQAIVERFRREAAALTRLRNRHTVKAYDLRQADDGTLYIVMELLRGESLLQRLRAQGPLPWRRVVHIARGICASLAEAHAAGIVHRDLKPANILLERRGEDPDFVKVVDFGIAKILQGSDTEHIEITRAGQMLGTIEYMSPEQMVGGELTGRSDIYALGVVIYEMITGRTPFAGASSAAAVVTAALTQAPEPMAHFAVVPPLLEQVVTCCLEPNARHRFPDITALADALAEVSVAAAPRLQTAPPMTSVRAQPVPPHAEPPRRAGLPGAVGPDVATASRAPVGRILCLALVVLAAATAVAMAHRGLGISPGRTNVYASELERIS